MATDLLGIAEEERLAALGDPDPRTQMDLGQFFTPIVAARLIASMPRIPESGRIRILDPRAGPGVLSAALIGRILDEHPDVSVELVAVRRDPTVIPHVKATLAACERADVEARVRSSVTTVELAELRDLKRRNRLVEQENEVLRRVAAYLTQANLPGK